jgi:hypothetical protein
MKEVTHLRARVAFLKSRALRASIVGRPALSRKVGEGALTSTAQAAGTPFAAVLDRGLAAVGRPEQLAGFGWQENAALHAQSAVRKLLRRVTREVRPSNPAENLLHSAQIKGVGLDVLDRGLAVADRPESLAGFRLTGDSGTVRAKARNVRKLMRRVADTVRS